MPNNNVFNESVGLLKRGTIVAYDESSHIMKVRLATTSSLKGANPQPIDVKAPHALFYNNGLYIGTLPKINTPVVIGQGSEGYYFVSFLSEDVTKVPILKKDQLLIHSNDDTKITLNTSNKINIGSDVNKISINTKSNLITTNFHNNNNFTQASRVVNGLIRRDLIQNDNFSKNSKLESDLYDSQLYVIGLDPTTSANSVISGSNKNPPFVELRELVYEFQYSSEVNNEQTESLLYGKSPNLNFSSDRRKSKSDTLSLTLNAPNYLIETVKGTVVDIYGNLLDLNRKVIPVGENKNNLRPSDNADKTKAFLQIKELERKSIAYHFELNARKDLTANGGVLPDINSKENYSRVRSRFFFDIDKEGQFKINIPSSSERGNVPLLTRYENFDSLGKQPTNTDIYHDSFAAPRFSVADGITKINKIDNNVVKIPGSITLKDSEADAGPIDRIDGTHIKHGMAYHDILATCYAHQIPDFLKYQAENFIDVNSIALLKNVATDTINISGPNANAGGRSGSINMDGSLELNIGANTVDRQSLWLDTAGGIVGNIGRDNKNMSAALSMNGDVFVQIGGMGVSTDTRFVKQANGHIGAALDIRVFNSGMRVTMIRIDDEGIKIMTPSNLQIHSGQSMSISSDADIKIECENLVVQGRLVLKDFGGSI